MSEDLARREQQLPTQAQDAILTMERNPGLQGRAERLLIPFYFATLGLQETEREGPGMRVVNGALLFAFSLDSPSITYAVTALTRACP